MRPDGNVERGRAAAAGALRAAVCLVGGEGYASRIEKKVRLVDADGRSKGMRNSHAVKIWIQAGERRSAKDFMGSRPRGGGWDERREQL